MIVVAKIGSSSLTAEEGGLDLAMVAKICSEVAVLQSQGHRVIIVSSGSISVGLAPLGLAERPREPELLRAASAIGQIELMARYKHHLASNGLVAGQVLLAPTDMWNRNRYLKSRSTLMTMLDRGVVPVINENDAVADEEIRFGDNDRLAALVAHLIRADKLILLTDTAGLFTADPRRDRQASLIEEIVEIDQRLEMIAGEAGSTHGTGGMASKLAAAKMATWSGVSTVIASAARPEVLIEATAEIKGVGTLFHPRSERQPARKLWIGFALASAGRIQVDAGARRALEQHNKSLLPVGVIGHEGQFSPGEAVELVDPDGQVFGKGLSQWSSSDLAAYAGVSNHEPNLVLADLTHEVIHRDDLVLTGVVN